MQINRAALTALRERSGMSKSELAERAGVDRTLVTRIENGDRRATPAVMKKFAAALQVSVVALMGPADEPPSEVEVA
jgi:transcriptional regulator with XRE-family HTH domain